MTRTRDHKAEYARRVASGAARGLSRSQARGHARHNEAPAKPRSAPKPDAKLEAGLKALHKTGNQAQAAKQAGVSPERLRRFLRENGYAERVGKTWRVTDPRRPQMRVYSEGEAKLVVLRDRDEASRNGVYLNAVQKFVRSNKRELIRPFEGQSVIDAKGKVYPFETDPNRLHELASNSPDVFHDVYRLVQ